MDPIRIGDKYYTAESVTDLAKDLLGDISKVEGELNRLSLQTSIANLARKTLFDKLVEEADNMEEAPATEVEESDSDEPSEPVNEVE